MSRETAHGALMRMCAPLEIGVCVRDLDAMVVFYRDVVGLQRVSEADLNGETAARAGFNETGFRIVRMQAPLGERIKLLQPVGDVARESPARYLLERPGIAYLTFVVEDVDAQMSRLADAGVELLSGREPIQTRPGTRIAFVRDVEGNALEFVSYSDLAAYRPDLFPA